MKKNLLLSFLFLFAFQLHAADYYWVGGGGDWSDLNHWRLGSSTGSIPSIVPAAGDNVIFGADAGFGTTVASRTIMVNANAFCNNMTWESGVLNDPILSGSAANKINIYGNLTLAPTVTYTTVGINFVGTNNAVLTTNGVISGTMSLTINKPGAELTLADDLIYTAINSSANTLDIVAGHLNARSKQLTLYSLSSNNSNNRFLDLNNAILNISIGIDIRGANKAFDATGSIITAARMYVDGGIFNVVNLGTASSGYLEINNTTFGKLTFTNTSPGSTARIHSNNIVDSLFFKGSGAIRNNTNTVNHVVFDGKATIGGSGNIIKYAELHAELDIIDQGNNVFDTLLTAPNKNILITRTNTINKYFRAGGLPCDGFTEINGAGGGTLAFSSEAKADIDNVLLTNLAATGPNTPIAVNGIDNGDNSGFIITEPTDAGQTLYWVGGAGDWNDKAHWSTSSGGSGGACIPFINDNIVFDGGSGFSGGNNTITTSGNTYCNDMTWASGIAGNPVFTTNASFRLRVYGSVVLNPSVTMNATMELTGTKSGTLTTNGSKLGTNRIIIRKSDANATSGLTLTDDWNNTSGRFDFVRGVLDLNNRKLTISEFVSNGSSGRNLNINNADITVYNWTYIGDYKSMSSTGSKILVNNGMVVRDLEYNIVECSATHSSFDIRYATFDQLLFSNPSLTSGARIGDGNTINRLEFKGQGMLRYGNNVLDTLITAENRNFSFYEGSNTINKYFKAIHPSCTGLGEIRTGGTTSTIVFGADAEVDIANVYMENIAATGGGGTLQLPIAFSGADAGGNSGWTILSGTGNARYWIGGGGDWNDAGHWSESSGGIGGACIPTVSNDVYFDENSGFGTTVATRTITVNNGNAYFHNMIWAGALNNPILTKASTWAMEGWGDSIILNPTVTLNISALQLKGPKATVLSGQTLGDFDLEIRKPGGSLTIANDYSNKATDFYLYEGDFNATGITLDIARIDNNSRPAAMSVNIEGSTINGNWRFNGSVANHTLLATNSVINSPEFFLVEGLSYNIVNYANAANAASTTISFNNTSIDKLTFTNPSSTSTTGINGNNNKLGTVEYKGSGIINGTGNEIETLIFFPGSSYTLTSGTNNTITGEWFGSGTPCKLTEIKSNSPSAIATITKTSGNVDFDYVRLTRIVATGGATFTAGKHSTDLGGSTGWDIEPYDGASPIAGLGPDIGLKTYELPYTIKTDGFFGSPLSQYEWKKDGNVVGTGNELVIMEPGTYSVKVNFPDGCTISDDITISLVSADLSVVKTVDNTTPEVGDNVVFILVAHNDGPGAGTDVTVTDKLPAGYTFISDTAPTGTTYDAATGLWTIGNLALDADLTLTITAQVNASGSYLNEATISGTSDDPDPDNNSSSVALVPSSALIITQPSCEIETGTIEVPQVSGGSYSINGGAFGPDYIFTDLVPGDYSIVVKIGDDTSTPVVVTINEAPITPDAPVSGGNQSVCATSPIQTLTATATVPAGSTIIWYDAPNVGNIVANPILNKIGTVVYYAETNNGTCTSKSRTAVVLSINEVPEITPLPDQEVCVQYILPPIMGTNLTGNEAYYTKPNGEGTKYLVGATLKNLGTQTLYIFDQKETNETCAGDINVTTNTTLSDNVFLHKYISASHSYYEKPVHADFWKGTEDQPIEYHTTGVTALYLNLVGDLSISGDPACTGGQVEIIVGATFKNEGPTAGAGYSGHIRIVNKQTGKTISQKDIQADFKVGAIASYTISAIVPAVDLLSGNLIVILGAETKQSGYKSWTLSGFKATYKYLSELFCPAEQSFKLTINPLPDAPISGGDQTVCATNPIQLLTATATVPAGTTIIWYDALVDGNVVAMPTLNTIGSVTYYAEAVSNNCTSEVRTPVRLTLVETPEIDPILDQSSCGPFTLPVITGTNLSGNQAYYTEINKGGTRYERGDIISALGETTLYAYDESTNASAGSAKAALELERDPNYTSAKLLELFPDNSRAFGRAVSGTLANGGGLTSIGSPSGKYNVVVGKLTLPSGYSNTEEYVQISVEDGWFRLPTVPPYPPISGYAGQLAIINLATNQLLYQTLFSDLPEANIRPSITGLVPTSDLIAGNIGIFMELKTSGLRVSDILANYQFVSNEMSCPVQQSFKVTINEIPDAPISGGDQEVCTASPVQTLTATAKAAAGSTVKWYDALVGGTEVANPTLNAIGSVTYYAEAYNGSCVSETRTAVTLTINESPVLSIHNPAVVCHPDLVDLTDAAITDGSTADLDFTYFEDAKATIPLTSPNAVSESGTYYIKGTNPITGCSTIAPVIVQFVDKPVVIAVHPDCVSSTGSISIASPLGADFEYSINGGTYSTNTVFENLAAGTYEIRASNSAVPGCVSDVTTVVINSTPTTAMPLVIQPDCDQPLGTIVFPVNAAYEYSIDGGIFEAKHMFTDLIPGTYSLRSKKAGDACIADAVEVIIVASESRPAQPVSLGDKQVCETYAAQQIVAEVAVDPGVAIVWYDALTGGNIISSPTLSTVGSITYYAEANNGTCTSIERTPVTLTITPLPVIYPISNMQSCGDIVLPTIRGGGLSAGAAYYTQPNGVGDRYNVGDAFGELGQTILYAYDTSVSGCSVEEAFTVFIHEAKPGAIGNDQTICMNTVPLELTSIEAGKGSGAISYRWERSTTDALTGFAVIPGAIAASYSPAALTETTYFRRIAISTANGIVCESAPTTPILINVIGELFANAGNDQLKYDSPVFTLEADIPTLGTGKWTIVSGTLKEGITDDTNPKAIITLRPNSSVTLRWTVSEMSCLVYDDVTVTYRTEADLVTRKSLKNIGQTTFVPGEEVVYMITLTNNGPSGAQNVTIKDTAPRGTVISRWAAVVTSGTVSLPNASGVGDVNETIAMLPNGAVVRYEVTVKTPSDFTGKLVNTVLVGSSTDDPDPACAACESVPLTPTEISSQLEFWKTGTYHDLNSNGKVDVGDVVNYSFIVRNTGNAQIDDIFVHDPIVPVNGGPISLAGGASDATAFSAVYAITQADIDKGSIYNRATAKGKDPFGNDITIGSKDPNPLDPNDPATITLLEARGQIALVKTVINTGTGNSGAFLLGDEIQYQFVVTNTGNTTLNDIVLKDPLISNVSIKLPGNLLPGVSVTHTAKYKVTLVDADKGHVLNQATVTAKDLKGTILEAVSGTALGNNDPTQTPISHVPPISDVPPRADDDRSETESGKTVIIRVLDNDRPGSSDIDPSSIEIVNRPLHGTLIVNPDGTVSYTPDAGYIGDDTFTYRIKDINGNWSNMAKVTITTEANDFFIPNVFTPNGDGRNDAFVILGLEGYDNAEVTIFNRWGNEVYRNKNYKNNWDGNGLNEATYYYLIVLKKEGKENLYKGWVLLKR